LSFLNRDLFPVVVRKVLTKKYMVENRWFKKKGESNGLWLYSVGDDGWGN